LGDVAPPLTPPGFNHPLPSKPLFKDNPPNLPLHKEEKDKEKCEEKEESKEKPDEGKVEKDQEKYQEKCDDIKRGFKGAAGPHDKERGFKKAAGPHDKERGFKGATGPHDKERGFKGAAGPLIKWIYQIFKALNFLHSKHIVHGDIKFDNIMIDKNGNIKLIDFGFSQHIFNNQIRREIIQSYWYRAPEVVLLDPYYDERVDIWSVGVIMMKLIFNYIICTKSDPLSSENPSDDEKIEIVLDYISVFGVPEGEYWKKLVTFYFDENANHNDNTKEIKRKLLIPTECLDREYAFNVWLKLNLGKSYDAALNFFGEKDLNDLVNIIQSCLVIDPSKRIQSYTVLKHPLFIRHGLNQVNFSPDYKVEGDEEKKEEFENKTCEDTYQFLVKKFKATQKIVNCHPNTIEIAIDITKRLLQRKKIIDLLTRKKILSPKIMGVTIIILAIKFNQGELTYGNGLMKKFVIDTLGFSEKYLDQVKYFEIKFFNLLDGRMISDECRKKLSPFENYFF